MSKSSNADKNGLGEYQTIIYRHFLLLLKSFLKEWRLFGHYWTIQITVQGEDKDKDAWIYSMQASMFELAKQQGGLEPVKWDQMGYAGKFVSFTFTK